MDTTLSYVFPDFGAANQKIIYQFSNVAATYSAKFTITQASKLYQSQHLSVLHSVICVSVT